MHHKKNCIFLKQKRKSLIKVKAFLFYSASCREKKRKQEAGGWGWAWHLSLGSGTNAWLLLSASLSEYGREISQHGTAETFLRPHWGLCRPTEE